jgi:putative ABC transport system ATP-binding protein
MRNYRVEALKNISIEIAEGEFISIVGPSGSGKSVLLRVIGGIERTSSGLVEICGVDISAFDDKELAKWRKSSVGIILKTPQLIQNLNIFENVMFPIDSAKYATREEQYARVQHCLQFVGLQDTGDLFPSELDAGRQRLAVIARAMVNDPLLIIGDEPEGNLDSHWAENVIQILKKLSNQGKTIIFVTHNTHFAIEASRIVALLDGQIVAKPATGGEEKCS